MAAEVMAATGVVAADMGAVATAAVVAAASALGLAAVAAGGGVAAAGAEATGAGATATGCGVVDGDKEKLRSAPTCINRLRLCVSKRGLRNRFILDALSGVKLGLGLGHRTSAMQL